MVKNDEPFHNTSNAIGIIGDLDEYVNMSKLFDSELEYLISNWLF